MRYTPEHKENTRARLLAVGGAVAKKDGFGSSGVDSLMAAVGLTSGAFYSHFRSKAELLDAIIDKELGQSIDLLGTHTREQLLQAAHNYLSLAHVAHPERGCPLPTLSVEVARAREQTRQIFEQRMLQLVAAIQRHVGEQQSWVIISQLAGAVMLARAMASEEARKSLLQAVMQQVTGMLSPTGAGAAGTNPR